MKDKNKILYERALIICVIMLFICVILKLFGANWFDFDTGIPILNKLDKIIMNSNVLSFIYSFVFKYINILLFYGIVCKTLKHKWFYIPIIMLSIIVNYFNTGFIYFVSDTIIVFVFCVYTSGIGICKEFTLAFILNIIYQLLSLFIRELNYHFSHYGLIIGTLLMVDYYIMLIITYLYLKKGGETLCSIIHRFGSFLVKKLCIKHLGS